MCEGRGDEKLTQVILDQLGDQPDDCLVEEEGIPSALADSYLGDYWGIGFGNRLHYD